jgi:hypothetical protein
MKKSEAEEMRLTTTRGVEDAPLPVIYEAAKAALAQCADVDECASWANKAAALASYARQSKDETLEKHAMRVRARAIRRCGELLSEVPAKPGKRTDLPQPVADADSRFQVAAKAGLSEKQAVTAIRVANVPTPDFEEAVESERPPTVTELAERGTQTRAAPLVDIQGRDPEEFNRTLHLSAAISRLVEQAAETSAASFVRGALPSDYERIGDAATQLMEWINDVLVELEKAQ